MNKLNEYKKGITTHCCTWRRKPNAQKPTHAATSAMQTFAVLLFIHRLKPFDMASHIAFLLFIALLFVPVFLGGLVVGAAMTHRMYKREQHNKRITQLANEAARELANHSKPLTNQQT